MAFNPSQLFNRYPTLYRMLRTSFWVGSLLVALVFLIGCLAPYIHPSKTWIPTAAALCLPYLALLLLLAGLVGLLMKWRRSWWLLIILLMGLQPIRRTVGWHLFTSFQPQKPPGDLRILSWNVSSWDETNKVQRGGTSYRVKMLEAIQQSNADVLCIQEFFEGKDPRYFEPTIPVLEKMGYRYHQYVASCTWHDSTSLGIGIFSKYPLTNTQIIPFDKDAWAQQMVQADLQWQGKTIRCFTVHLQSFHLGSEDYAQLHGLKEPGKKGWVDSRTMIDKFAYAIRMRSKQAEQVGALVAASPYPVIVAGDFNDVATSYTYHTILGSRLQDAFVAKGKGLGRTFHYLAPTLRIDYVLADRALKVHQYNTFRYKYSEHNGVLADLAFP